MEEETFEEKARRLVIDFLIENDLGEEPGETVKVVWFCKTLQNWKAIIADLSKGGMLFEVTYNGNKEEAYIDAYTKFENVCVPD